MSPRRLLFTIATLALVATACSDEDDATASNGDEATSAALADGSQDLPLRPSMFDAGCPEPGRSTAAVIEGDGAPMAGSRVVSGAGDLVLANDRAAFVVSAPVSEESPQRTWYHYGGIVVDAAALDGCEQVSPDGIDEVGLVVGQLDLAEFAHSTLRAFRADTVEVINDGADGEPAIVRASGTDDRLQLIEYQLVREAAASGSPKELSEPLGIRIEVDYVLAADDPVLSITTRVIAEQDGLEPLLGAALVTWSDQLESVHRAESVLELGSFGVDLGIPWQLAHDETGSFAFSVADANPAVVPISGVQSFVDAGQVLGSPMEVAATGDSAEMTFLLAAGPADANSAVRHLPDHDPELGPAPSYMKAVSGTVVDAAGDPVPDVRVDVEMSRDGEDWSAYDVFSAGDDGSFEGELVVLPSAEGADPMLRLRFVAPGRADATAEISDGDAPEYPLGPAGSVEVAVTDDSGDPLPARVSLYSGDDLAHQFDTPGESTEAVAPGTYDVVVSRGFEYDRSESSLTVTDGSTVELSAELERVVDTSGWLSLDTHVHTAPSPDSTMAPRDRMLDAAAVGLEVVVNTNHELIEDLGDEREASGLADEVAMITGQEVTASSPEHTTMYPVDPDGSIRGGNPLWYGLDLGEIYALEADRGASVRGLNHPAEYFEVIEFDPVTGTAGLDDPSTIGLDPEAELWSWDFEQIELQNGANPVLLSDSDDEGLFDFWQSAFNHGERVTAVGASDAHGPGVGDSLTYVRVDDDNPATVGDDAVSEAVTAGRAVVSTGAFAEVEVDGAGPGDTASGDPGPVDVHVRVQAAPGIDLSTIRVFANCDQVASIEVDPTDDVVRLDDVIEIDLDSDANITVLGFGERALPRPFNDFDARRVPRFTSNPVFVDVDGNGDFDAPGDKGCSYPR